MLMQSCVGVGACAWVSKHSPDRQTEPPKAKLAGERERRSCLELLRKARRTQGKL